MADEQFFADHLGLELSPRSRKKPRARNEGINMVIDHGLWPASLQRHFFEMNSQYVDVMKVVAAYLEMPVSEVKRKIEIMHEYGVKAQPGGIIVEIARYQNRGEGILDKLKDLGFDQLEVSASAADSREMEREAEFIQKAISYGFTVYGEVGQKFAEGDSTRAADDLIDVEETIKQFKALLEAGADRCYWEGHLLRRLFGETPGEILARQDRSMPQVMEVVDAVGKENIVFETSSMIGRQTRRTLQFWLIHTFGPEVNMGNVRLEEVTDVEQMRRGHYPVFGFGPAGDHPWMHSLQANGGKASEQWWTEFPLAATQPSR